MSWGRPPAPVSSCVRTAVVLDHSWRSCYGELRSLKYSPNSWLGPGTLHAALRAYRQSHCLKARHDDISSNEDQVRRRSSSNQVIPKASLWYLHIINISRQLEKYRLTSKQLQITFIVHSAQIISTLRAPMREWLGNEPYNLKTETLTNIKTAGIQHWLQVYYLSLTLIRIVDVRKSRKISSSE